MLANQLGGGIVRAMYLRPERDNPINEVQVSLDNVSWMTAPLAAIQFGYPRDRNNIYDIMPQFWVDDSNYLLVSAIRKMKLGDPLWIKLSYKFRDSIKNETGKGVLAYYSLEQYDDLPPVFSFTVRVVEHG